MIRQDSKKETKFDTTKRISDNFQLVSQSLNHQSIDNSNYNENDQKTIVNHYMLFDKKSISTNQKVAPHQWINQSERDTSSEVNIDQLITRRHLIMVEPIKGWCIIKGKPIKELHIIKYKPVREWNIINTKVNQIVTHHHHLQPLREKFHNRMLFYLKQWASSHGFIPTNVQPTWFLPTDGLSSHGFISNQWESTK